MVSILTRTIIPFLCDVRTKLVIRIPGGALQAMKLENVSLA